eukprot:2392879-Rhodomonas_salina.1
MESVSTVTGWSGGVPWRARNIAAASARKEDGGPPTWVIDTSSPGLTRKGCTPGLGNRPLL